MKTEIFALALVIALAPSVAFAQQVREAAPPVIIVSSTSQVEAVPDQATVRLGVVRQAQTALSAQNETNRAVQAILAELAKLGVPAAKIQTSRLMLTPIYAPQRPENREAPRIMMYNATNMVSVELDNLAQIGPVIDAGLTAGANQLEGVRFGLKNDVLVRDKALRQAVADARRKAEAMADALGVRLAGVLEANESGVSVIAQDEAVSARFMAAQAGGASTPVSPGELEVRASVTVKYSISPR